MSLRRGYPVFFASALLAGCTSTPATLVCNGHASLCDKPYDQVVFPGTHDAYSDKQEHFGAPDQSYPLSRQLSDGIRVLHLEAYYFDDDINLCHAYCEIGAILLSDALKEVRAFMDANPHEVVTLLMESTGVTRDQINATFAASGLLSYVHSQATGAAWPTLGEMIGGAGRLVVYNDDTDPKDGAFYPWLLDRFAVTWETPWNNKTPSDFLRCNADRGTQGNPIYVVDNYYEDMILPTAAGATRVNDNPFLIDRVRHCQDWANQLPNYVMVNYYEVGDVFAVVDALNGFTPTLQPDWDAFPSLDSALDAGVPVSWDGSLDGSESDAAESPDQSLDAAP